MKTLITLITAIILLSWVPAVMAQDTESTEESTRAERPWKAGFKNDPRGHADNGRFHHEIPPHMRGKGVTPYGDFCDRCSVYGGGKQNVSHDVAVEAVKDYFNEKNLMVINVRGHGRFLKADIYKDKQLVDIILFDRKTGRIRSIY